MEKRQKIVDPINKRIAYIITFTILCCFYLFCLFSSYSFYSMYKQNGILFFFAVSFIINLITFVLSKKRLLFIIISTIGINLLYIITILIFTHRNLFRLMDYELLIEGILFYAFCLLVSGNWLLPFIIFCFSKVEGPVPTNSATEGKNNGKKNH